MKAVKGFIIIAIFALMVAVGSKAVANEVVIGFTGPLSGLGAEYGQDVYNGIALAVKEINASGGIDVGGERYAVTLKRLDDGADPTRALNNARRLQSEGAIAIFNPLNTTAASMMDINEEEGEEFLLMVFTSSQRIMESVNRLSVVTPGPFVSMAEIGARWAMDKGWERCAMVVTFGPYGDDWRSTFREIWEGYGGTITVERPANYFTETDFSSPITAALATNPDVMLIGGPSSTTALVIEQSRMMGYKGGFIVIDQAKLDYIKTVLGGADLIGDAIGTPGVGIPSREGQDFAPRYREEYRRAATAESSFNYAFVHVLARAISAAGTTTDVYKIRDAFPEAFPLLATESPMEVHGINDEGRLLVVTATQTVTDGEFDTPEIYFWWPETGEEYEYYRDLSEIDSSIPRRWLQSR